MRQTVAADAPAQYLQEELEVLGPRQESPLILLQHIYTHKRLSVAYKLHFQRFWLNANTIDFLSFLFFNDCTGDWLRGSGALPRSIPPFPFIQASAHTRGPGSFAFSLDSCLPRKRFGDSLHLFGIYIICTGINIY